MELYQAEWCLAQLEERDDAPRHRQKALTEVREFEEVA
jgi:hypothetical protein